jgi:3-(3-hydroxy-phenyl)propionate hydroxylase
MATPPLPRGFVPYPFEFDAHAAPAIDRIEDGARHAVAIVGGGIAGLTLALDLAVQGVPSVVLEADDTVCFGSRAICFSRRSLEIFERIGALAPVLEKGLAWTGGRSFHRNTEVLHFQMPHDRLQKLPPMINLQQYHVEAYLLQALEAHADLVDLRWQSRVRAVEARDDGVVLEVEQPGRVYALHADWVVACDGGRSTLREALGLRLEGTAYEGRYVVADIALESTLPTERLAWFDPPSNPGSTILMHRQPDGIWRIDYQLRDDEDADAAVRPEQVLPRVEAHLRMIGQTGRWAPIWITLYRANALTLPSYRHGRVLFAGDAAHLVPIFGVRGANSTIDDVDNLAWKLALVVDGRADPALLDTYSAERVQAARENLAYGSKSTQFMAPPDFAFRTMREAVLDLAVETPAIRSLINPRQSSPVRYARSALNATPADADGFAAGPGAGSVLPTAPVRWLDAAGRARPGHLTDALEAGVFTLFAFADGDAVAPAISALCERWAGRGIRLRIVSVRPGDTAAAGADASASDPGGEVAALYGALAGALYAVRPDGHVLGRWREADAGAIDDAIRTCLAGGRHEEHR